MSMGRGRRTSRQLLSGIHTGGVETEGESVEKKVAVESTFGQLLRTNVRLNNHTNFKTKTYLRNHDGRKRSMGSH